MFIASCDKQVKCWDLGSDQVMQVAQHDAAVKTCHWVKNNSNSYLMTGSWDKTLKVCWNSCCGLASYKFLKKNAISLMISLLSSGTRARSSQS